MTFKVAKSKILPNFEVSVAQHANEMRTWRAHMSRVDADAKSGVGPDERHVAYPKPAAHPFVEAAVNHDDVADYEIVDDGPTPAQLLRIKKDELLRAVTHAEQAAIEMVLPIGKHRLVGLRENDIRAADAVVAQAHVNKSRWHSDITAAIGLTKPLDVATEVENARSAEDTRFLAEQAARREKITAISRAAAQMHHDIEDLAIENIDAWEMTPFPT